MANLLYLVHRLPYPPNKGDKVRSYHVLKHLLAGHRVFLGTFVDDPDDQQHVPVLQALCADVCAVPLRPATAKLRSLTALAEGQPLTLNYYRSRQLDQWVRQTVRSQAIDAVIVFSSSMAQYIRHAEDLPVLVDLVDVDSAKWTEYARARRWPMSWLYAREGRRLLAYERRIAAAAHSTFLVTEKEAALFRTLAPECAPQVQALGNGVDAAFFAPDEARANPFDADELPLVFTGAMDYWPNVDAVEWFVAEVLPGLRQRWPRLRLHIVGRSPTPAVQALASEAVRVTGTVPDVRPWLQHATAVVAPLRLARGVQNKVLEAMAMARPVVCAGSCAEAIDASDGHDLLAADEPADYLRQLDRLLQSPAQAQALGEQGRRFMLQRYSWAARLAPLDRLLAQAVGAPVPPAVRWQESAA
ncbi:TIGR03087 family PEP-CTERM/XrtA system glycosyltransferase [Aquincola sp. J276]|uniref:TIGR03087 family PEP-CTERM/XrtA system glycosyltransferase n=1 Tax=Aquincola sp. J276 TaxID=2898432 RepID=UPI002151872C|nr:TIGR03087 family PEP-CTERM/XrtA system glycosyltransferase [Aquincola sp. J276]MCR5866061.1 TIGR03087 family PEP-CTERM/XrtA system glycosyltransferase [Aquincola sp. J276]